MNEPIRIELPTIYETMGVNSWLIKYPEPVLVDCGEGTDESWEALNAQLATAGVRLKDISRVIITHAHMDHMGAANRIARYSNAEIWMPEFAKEWAIDLRKMLDRRVKAFAEAYLELFPRSTGPKRMQRDYDMLSPYWEEVTEDRLRIFPMKGTIEFGGGEWQILYTPGHCINQTCFYRADKRWLLSADMLLKRIAIPLIDAQMEPPYKRGRSVVMMMQSYEKLRELKIERVFPGHWPAFENAGEVIDRQTGSILAKKTKALQLIRRGINNFHDIQQNIYSGRRNPGTFLMTLGVIDLLKHEGRIEGRLSEEGLLYFAIN